MVRDATSYQCALCKGTFDYIPEWTDEDAATEHQKLFGNPVDEQQDEIVCDDCFKKMGMA